MKSSLLTLALLGLLAPLPTSAQEREMVTDRPDVAESAVTVGRGTVQLETGVSLIREGDDHLTTFPTLLRIGAGERWELRLESDMLTLRNPGTDSFSDVALGAKLNLMEGESTNLGLLFNLNLPLGIEELRGSVDPELKFLWDQDLGGDWSLGFNAGLALTEEDVRFVRWAWAASISHPLSESLDAFVEAFGEGPETPGGAVYTGADTGILWKVSDNFQLDASYTRGLSNFGPEWGVGVGASARF